MATEATWKPHQKHARLTKQSDLPDTGIASPGAAEESWDVQPAGTTMKAVVLDGPGPPSALHIRQVPRPHPQRGWVLISVRAFGLNRSELHMRLGLAEGLTFPRVPGIEAVGVVAECPGGEFAEGQQVATMLGGVGRAFDGGYAAYCCVPAAQVLPFRSDLDWTPWAPYRRCCRRPAGRSRSAWTPKKANRC